MLKPIKAIKTIKIKAFKRIGSLSWVRREKADRKCVHRDPARKQHLQAQERGLRRTRDLGPSGSSPVIKAAQPRASH